MICRLILLTASAALPVAADTIEIQPGTSAYEMAQIVESAQADDVVLFLAGEHNFSGQSYLDARCTLRGELDRNGRRLSTIIATACSSTCSFLYPNALRIEDLNMAYGGPAYLIEITPSRSLTLANCEITGSTSGYGILVRGSNGNRQPSLTATGTVFSGFSRAIQCESHATISLDGCRFHSNGGGNYGSALYISGYCNVTIDNCTFDNNSSYFRGGAVSAWYWNIVQIQDSTFADNSTSECGMALHAQVSSQILAENCVFCGPGSQTCASESGSIDLSDCLFSPDCVDCNSNDLPDYLEIAEDADTDCDDNGTLDECELPDRDCDSNGRIDACDLADGALDIDADGVLDACQCRPDLNGDNIVNAGDLGLLVAAWGTDGSVVEDSDLNGDGVVGPADLGVMLGDWGPCR